MKKILITQGWPKEYVTKYDECIALLESRGFEVQLNPKRVGLTEDELIESLQGVTVHMCGMGNMTERVLENAKDLKLISKFGVGLESINIPAATARGIAVVNSPSSCSEPVAEFTVTLMLAAARNLLANDRLARSGRWGRTLGISPYRKTLGIIGFGNIGQTLAKTVSGFDMKVIAYNPSPRTEAAKRLNVQMVTFDELIQNSDFISLHVPYSRANENMINADVFAKMKSTAILINTSRGAIVDENALYYALRDGIIGGAALDVYKKEPISMDNPILTLDNCILTTHNSSSSYEGRNRLMEDCVQNVLDIMDGISPNGLVNPQVFSDKIIGL